jgi:hypothetical protein
MAQVEITLCAWKVDVLGIESLSGGVIPVRGFSAY